MSKKTRSPGQKVLRELYHDQQLSYRDIADKLHVAPVTAHKWLIKAGIQTRPKGTKQRRGHRNKLIPTPELRERLALL